jgi:hypothetical protein
MLSVKNNLFLLFILIILSSCHSNDEQFLYHHLPSDSTGIEFSNTITTSDSINAENSAFIYNGAGVATGDINNDGLVDIFFTGNMVSSRLYLNRGNMKFEDITESAGVPTSRWATGASIVDINGDGYLDIYVSVSNSKQIEANLRRNLLFINNGDNTFTEAATSYGIDDSGFTTHAAFLDYDRDGDLDLFLLNNSPEEFSRGHTGVLPMGGQNESSPSGFDQLYQNNGDGTFTNVSGQAGILRKLGYGLGVAISDLNGDGWPDIYVSNDISPNDVLYINNGDGTFTDRAPEWLRHTSYAGMGIDIADFTNNCWPDILQIDMMPEEISGRKLMSGSTTYGAFIDLEKQGYFPHYNTNTLQMNQGVNDDGGVIFSEVARMAGVAYTNWSWTALFADMDNNGFKDILITNGYPKALNDFDYLSDMHAASQTDSREIYNQRRDQILNELHGYEIPNYLFRNNGDLTFTDRSGSWGMTEPGFSYGAAYADLNNNGRLDLVINNINAPASLYQNMGPPDSTGHYLQVALRGEAPNTGGIGAKIRVWAGGQQQFKYHNPYRGFMSTVDGRLHFGLDTAPRVDSLQVTWPDGKSQRLTDIASNQIITLRQEEATEQPASAPLSFSNQPFREIPAEQTPEHTDRGSGAVDYNIQPLLPYMISRQGPALAAGDVNGDGLDDLYIGGAAGHPGRLFMQQEDGQFTESTQTQPWQADSDQEDWDAVFVDANGDGLPDLYVASGGYRSSPVSLLLQDRLYINYGDGRFLKDTNALPEMLTSTGTVAAGDFNGDGRVDLFVGGRLAPRNWPYPTRSYLLRNDGDRFTDVTSRMAPELIEPGGMVTDAVWFDFNGDGQADLVTAGEWMPVRFYRNDGDNFTEVTGSMGLPPGRGWWQSLVAGDFNGDGHPDLAAGNLGLNHTYTASPDSPFGVVAGDFSGNRTTDIILTTQIDGTEYPLYGLAKLGRDIYTLGIQYDSFETFAHASVEQVIGRQTLQQTLRYQADSFASVWMENNADGTFSVHPLPNLAQISPLNDMIATDADGDGHLDLVAGGNMYHTEPTAPRADAGNGLWLKGDGQGNFQPVPPTESGLMAPGDVKSLALVRTDNGTILIVGNNNEPIQIFNVNRTSLNEN